MEAIKPCPFCGENLEKYPHCMIIQKVNGDFHEEYLKLLKQNKIIIGSDDDVVVICPRCGSRGRSDINEKLALRHWNQRSNRKEVIVHGQNKNSR